MKRCSRCKETKPKREFCRCSTNKDGLNYFCKACRKEYDQTPEGIASHRRADASARGRATRKRYMRSKKGKAVCKRYAQSPKGRAVQAQGRARRRSALENVECTLTTEEWTEIKADHDCCPYCGEPFECEPTMDHVIPLSRGGTHVAGNVLPACQPCNSSKGNKTLEEWNGQVAASEM